MTNTFKKNFRKSKKMKIAETKTKKTLKSKIINGKNT